MKAGLDPRVLGLGNGSDLLFVFPDVTNKG